MVFTRTLLVVASLAMAMPTVWAQSAPEITCQSTNLFRGDCSRFIDSFCDNASATTYRPGESLSRCFTNIGNRCDLTVWLQNGNGRDQRPTAARLQEFPSNRCNLLPISESNWESGGEAKYPDGAFRFTIDPNRGECSPFAAAGPAN
ncbi:hypothetical protein BKA70DRAFT_1301647 [Coprinopsis sp. MPI-PUGE-AT-0042]|nr:hypothetical protein BKA70DRAFT_1301647 [Coprinopsis sp. MPI-PUGE-AT-0042]